MFNTIVVTLIAMVAIPIIIGTSVKNPKLTALSIIAVLFLCSSSTWGQLQIQNTIYSRGSGELYFSLINVFLFIAGSAVLVRKLADPYYPSIAPSVANYFRGFVFLLFAHAVVGVVSGIDIWTTLGYSGIINVINMLIFMYLAIMAFREEKDRNKLLAAILVIAGLRAIFGLVRYQWFGGDSANPYQNFERLDIKLVFFDMSDNFVVSLAAFCAAWLLTSPQVRLSALQRLALYGYLALEVAAVTLSFRRSALLGMGLMFAFLICRLPGRRRIQFLLIGGAIVFVAAGVFFEQRLQFASKGEGGMLSSLIYDITPDKSIESGSNRFYELYAAAQSVGNNWLFGLGTWGTFRGDEDALSYHFGKFDFVHSGFGHIILKTGLVGLALFVGLLIQFCRYYFRHCNKLHGTARLLADAGFAGFLFWFPTLMIGTPIIEFRTMLLIGLTLALPFIAVGIKRYQAPRQFSYAPA